MSVHLERPRTDGVAFPHRFLLYRLRPLGRFVIRRRFRITMHGTDRVPRTGPVIFASNHTGVIDGPLLAIFSPRPAHALTKVEMFKGKMGLFLTWVGQIKLDRFNTDPAAVRESLRVLRDGGAVGIFPEGLARRRRPRAVPPRGRLPGDGHRRADRAGDHARHPRARRSHRVAAGPRQPDRDHVRRAGVGGHRALAAHQAGGRGGLPHAPGADAEPTSPTRWPPPASRCPGRCPRASGSPIPAAESRRSQHDGVRHGDRGNRTGAGAGRGRPPQRRQVHAGQPDPRPARGGRRGRARA